MANSQTLEKSRSNIGVALQRAQQNQTIQCLLRHTCNSQPRPVHVQVPHHHIHIAARSFSSHPQPSSPPLHAPHKTSAPAPPLQVHSTSPSTHRTVHTDVLRNPGGSNALLGEGLQLYYPRWMFGEWTVASRFVGFATPLGASFVSPDTIAVCVARCSRYPATRVVICHMCMHRGCMHLYLLTYSIIPSSALLLTSSLCAPRRPRLHPRRAALATSCPTRSASTPPSPTRPPTTCALPSDCSLRTPSLPTGAPHTVWCIFFTSTTINCTL